MLLLRHPAFGGAVLTVAAACACAPATGQDGPAHAPAGSVIVNVAGAQLPTAGGSTQSASNAATLRVDELLDLRLASSAQGASVAQGPATAVPLTLTDAGNGNEAFVLDLAVQGSGATPDGFALDRDGDGRFDPAVDLAIASGGTTPVLAPGDTVRLLALVRGDGETPTGSLIVRARASTGSGDPGTSFPGRGDGGGDAVVGATTAMGQLSFPLGPVGPAASGIDVSLVKSQSVVAANGTAVPGPGATITYSIAAAISGNGVARAVRIADAIPVGTAYVPGSLLLDGAPVSDAADADGGSFDGSGVAVALGDVAAPATHSIQFQVTIQ